MNSLRRTRNTVDGCYRVEQYAHHNILADRHEGVDIWLVREPEADPADLDDNVDCCWSLADAEKSREEMSWCDVDDEIWEACQ